MKIIFIPNDTTGTSTSLKSKFSTPSDDKIADNKYNSYSNWNLYLCFIDLSLFCVLGQELLMRWDFFLWLFLSLLEHFLVVLLKGFRLWHFYRCYWKFNYYEICYFKAKFYMQCRMYFILIKIIFIWRKFKKKTNVWCLFSSILLRYEFFWKSSIIFPSEDI